MHSSLSFLPYHISHVLSQPSIRMSKGKGKGSHLISFNVCSSSTPSLTHFCFSIQCGPDVCLETLALRFILFPNYVVYLTICWFDLQSFTIYLITPWSYGCIFHNLQDKCVRWIRAESSSSLISAWYALLSSSIGWRRRPITGSVYSTKGEVS